MTNPSDIAAMTHAELNYHIGVFEKTLDVCHGVISTIRADYTDREPQLAELNDVQLLTYQQLVKESLERADEQAEIVTDLLLAMKTEKLKRGL